MNKRLPIIEIIEGDKDLIQEFAEEHRDHYELFSLEKVNIVAKQDKDGLFVFPTEYVSVYLAVFKRVA